MVYLPSFTSVLFLVAALLCIPKGPLVPVFQTRRWLQVSCVFLLFMAGSLNAPEIDKQNNNEPQAQVESTPEPTAEPTPEPTPETEPAKQSTSQQVYIAGSGSGKKYHRDPSCSRMKNPVQISIEEAQSRGYTSCSKC